MQVFKQKLKPTSVQRKVIAGFLLVFIAIVLALGISNFGFREMMETVDQLSAPNKELNALNTIFQEITALDQTQRAEAIKNPAKSYKTFLNQSKSLVNKIDSLRTMNWDSVQRRKLLDIKDILQRRNRLFFSYLKLKSELIDNRNLTSKLDTLSRMLVNEKVTFDTSVVTTEKKTITTYTDSVPDQKDQRSGIAKFFSRKKKVTPQTTHIKVEEQLSVVVDTLSVARQNKALEEVEKIILDLENDQRAENKRLLSEELELIHANSILINQLLGILHEVENEELAHMRRNNNHAVELVTESILRIVIVLIAFFIGAAFLVYLIWVDISKSNYYKVQLEKAKDEAEELSLIKQRFLANMSHEIRTPLQSIIGFAEQLRQEDGLNSEAVSAINSSSEHLLHIVDEVLDYSRISSGNFVLNREAFEIIPLIREVESALHVQADRKGLTLLLDLEFGENFQVQGDPFRLRQILYNLLGNAIKFTAKGFVKLALRTEAEQDRIQCTFEISDTGIGIRQEDINKIFNQFEQANSLITRNYGGTGLGLTIVKSLVEAQHGTLDVKSEPGQGSVFTVKLAYEKTEAGQPSPDAVQSNILPVFRGKVIVVDDDAMILRLCGLILAKNGIRYITYSDANKLIGQKADPEVTHILMDIRMPEINGVELCHILRKKYNSTTTFVALTAHVFSQQRQELINEGFDAVLGKPFRERELLNLFGVVQADDNSTTSEGDEMDLSTLRLMTAGDETLFQSILNQFMDETETDIVQLNDHIRTMNPGPVREIVHKLAGRLGQVGVESLSGRFRSIETKMADGIPLYTLVEKIISCREDTEKVLQKIRHEVMAQTG